MFKIDKDIPLARYVREKMPLGHLKVGESIEFPSAMRRYVDQAASQRKRRKGEEYTIRKQNDEVCRIWRIK